MWLCSTCSAKSKHTGPGPRSSTIVDDRVLVTVLSQIFDRMEQLTKIVDKFQKKDVFKSVNMEKQIEDKVNFWVREYRERDKRTNNVIFKNIP